MVKKVSSSLAAPRVLLRSKGASSAPSGTIVSKPSECDLREAIVAELFESVSRFGRHECKLAAELGPNWRPVWRYSWGQGNYVDPVVRSGNTIGDSIGVVPYKIKLLLEGKLPIRFDEHSSQVTLLLFNSNVVDAVHDPTLVKLSVPVDTAAEFLALHKYNNSQHAVTKSRYRPAFLSFNRSTGKFVLEFMGHKLLTDKLLTATHGNTWKIKMLGLKVEVAVAQGVLDGHEDLACLFSLGKQVRSLTSLSALPSLSGACLEFRSPASCKTTYLTRLTLEAPSGPAKAKFLDARELRPMAGEIASHATLLDASLYQLPKNNTTPSYSLATLIKLADKLILDVPEASLVNLKFDNFCVKGNAGKHYKQWEAVEEGAI
ncbi:hypothetical protein JCM11641_003391 [Rhodosporidiobolus odoratus]